MVIVGLICLVLGLLLGISLLTWIGVVLLALGLCLWLAGSTGHSVGGRSHWY